jgi:hypothetical protein
MDKQTAQIINGVKCVGEINETTERLEFYSWDLGGGRQDDPENKLVLEATMPLLYDDPITFDWMVEQRNSPEATWKYDQIVAV